MKAKTHAKSTSSLTGPAMKIQLESAGITPRSVTRRQDSGFYVAEFYNTRMQDPVQPSRVYANAIEERLGELEIVDTHDTVADWRPGQPIIWASVTFRIAS